MLSAREIDKIYNTALRPRMALARTGMVLALMLFLLFFITFLIRISSGREVWQGRIPVAPQPLNEDPLLENDPAAWSMVLERYAVPVSVSHVDDFYRFSFSIRSLPVDNVNWITIGFEVYDENDEYLFTFYGDDYWHMSGYDEGYWEEQKYKEKLDVRFPAPGTYQIVAGMANENNREEMYEVLARYSGGEVTASLKEGIKPVNPVIIVLAILLFLLAAVYFGVTNHGGMSRRRLFENGFNMKENYYLCKLHSGNGQDIYQVTSFYFVKTGVLEISLQREGQVYFIEMEREYDREDSRYSYSYYCGKETEYKAAKTVPDSPQIVYESLRYKQCGKKSLLTRNYRYENGLQDTIRIEVAEYKGVNSSNYLSFEKKPDEDKVYVTLTRKCMQPVFWEVKK